MDNSQPLTVRRTPSAAPTALASFSAAVLATIMDTSVFERSVLQAALSHSCHSFKCSTSLNLTLVQLSLFFKSSIHLCEQGEFPVLLAFGPLGASTMVISVLLWVTQRRKVKSVWGWTAFDWFLSLSAMIYWAETDCSERENTDTRSEVTPGLFYDYYAFVGQLCFIQRHFKTDIWEHFLLSFKLVFFLNNDHWIILTLKLSCNAVWQQT